MSYHESGQGADNSEEDNSEEDMGAGRHGQAAAAPVLTDAASGEAPVKVIPPVPIERKKRSLAPDIARGLLLMFIAMANVNGFHTEHSGSKPEISGLDRLVAGLEGMFVFERSRPMFAILYGFGIAMMASRMATTGVDDRGIRRVLRRRSLWLMLFGVVHAVFLWYGDILGPYGATGLIALFLVTKSNRVLRRWFWGSVPLQAIGTFILFMFIFAGKDDGGKGSEQLASYPQYMFFGFITQVIFQFMSVVFLVAVPLVIVGFWLFRSGWLVHPQEHLPQLRRTFWITMVTNVILSIPIVLLDTGFWDPSHFTTSLVQTFNVTVGAATGVGYVCGFALLAARWADRGRNGLPGVLAAVGERSMTAYLSQSVLFFAVVTGFGLGLGEHLGTAGDAVTAIAVWSVIAMGMVVLSRLGRRGPFEVLIRWLTYRASSRASLATRTEAG